MLGKRAEEVSFWVTPKEFWFELGSARKSPGDYTRGMLCVEAGATGTDVTDAVQAGAAVTATSEIEPAYASGCPPSPPTLSSAPRVGLSALDEVRSFQLCHFAGFQGNPAVPRC
jgi:hypothetical protein